MEKYNSDMWEEFLSGRAYLPVYALLAQGGTNPMENNVLIPPIKFWENTEE